MDNSTTASGLADSSAPSRQRLRTTSTAFVMSSLGCIPPRTAKEAQIEGEAYEVDYETLRSTFLPREPHELELGVIELADAKGSLAMVLRPEHLEDLDVKEISSHGGWRAYRGLPSPD